LNTIKRKIAAIPKQAFDVFYQNTPVRSGNARRNTRRSGDRIVANYPYAQRLDQGWSKQSPEGMIKPTEEFVAKRLQEIAQGK
jgi:hypothetical protein